MPRNASWVSSESWVSSLLPVKGDSSTHPLQNAIGFQLLIDNGIVTLIDESVICIFFFAAGFNMFGFKLLPANVTTSVIVFLLVSGRMCVLV